MPAFFELSLASISFMPRASFTVALNWASTLIIGIHLLATSWSKQASKHTVNKVLLVWGLLRWGPKYIVVSWVARQSIVINRSQLTHYTKSYVIKGTRIQKWFDYHDNVLITVQQLASKLCPCESHQLLARCSPVPRLCLLYCIHESRRVNELRRGLVGARWVVGGVLPTANMYILNLWVAFLLVKLINHDHVNIWSSAYM